MPVSVVDFSAGALASFWWQTYCCDCAACNPDTIQFKYLFAQFRATSSGVLGFGRLCEANFDPSFSFCWKCNFRFQFTWSNSVYFVI